MDLRLFQNSHLLLRLNGKENFFPGFGYTLNLSFGHFFNQRKLQHGQIYKVLTPGA